MRLGKEERRKTKRDKKAKMLRGVYKKGGKYRTSKIVEKDKKN